tara:strand:+ start:879 stop:1829 length:951 start_codon:yes stop_codon:yes gene_type:complete
MSSSIAGIGSYLPKQVITNHDLEKTLDTSDEWIMQRVGIAQRQVLSEGETTSMMAVEAAKCALEDSGLSPNDIDMVIVATATSEYCFPSVACMVQRELGITNASPAFDVSAACAGFIYGLSIADQYIRSCAARHVLVIGAESLSKYVNWQDRSTCILFGDGAGAVILSQSDSPGILATKIHALGEHVDLLYAKSSHWSSARETVQMDGSDVFKLAVTKLNEIVDQTLAMAGMHQGDVDWLIPHQANMRIIKAIAKRLSLPEERVILTIKEHANTSSASVPLAFDVAVKSGKVKRGDRVMLEAFGAGLAWGAVLLTF